MTLISIASSFAIVLGFAGTLPHIRTMVRSRSSNGQSPTGWLIGILVNVMTGYVNLAGLGAVMLGVGNVIAGSFAAVALFCVIRYRSGEPVMPAAAEAAAAADADVRPLATVHELPTGEFTAIKTLIDEEHARRESFRVDADVAERAFADLGEPVAVAA
ncbi:hypothetical protein Q5424_17845 [Conexibacter sp. JD483]|uniref:hypothetical protein n=1 Tax=unclassified Conexibacter TaxID=2627773 RepID=UPI0027268F0A|nr:MULTISPECIES: hypothetical protein [unclassified Conexibacter]MDO8185733.1 hypothetical protein [Conexibacter sp. CPCC 205706]MDO8199110.1 hypothetical protein [Conexibacter sp. CPCC 205762]MDR9370964.1 hypothetical protein [Conexibacter sp. JD483]